MEYVVAQVNIGRLVVPLDSPEVADFVAGLDPVNAAADGAPGFVWRLQSDDGNATGLSGFEQDGEGSGGGIIINMSVWETVEALAAFAYGPTHIAVLRRRREWFERMRDAYAALWWIPRGHVPTIAEAEDRVKHLRTHGPTPYAFTFKVHFPPGRYVPAGRSPVPSENLPDEETRTYRTGHADSEPLYSPEDWACPV